MPKDTELLDSAKAIFEQQTEGDKRQGIELNDLLQKYIWIGMDEEDAVGTLKKYFNHVHIDRHEKQISYYAMHQYDIGYFLLVIKSKLVFVYITCNDGKVTGCHLHVRETHGMD